MDESLNQTAIRKIFYNSELLTSKLKLKNSHIKILYRCVKNESGLNFIVYDFEKMYICQQDFNRISSLNKELNPSLEFEEIESLLNFLLENLLKSEKQIHITRNEERVYCFEVLVEIVNLKWLFECKEINCLDCTYLIQDLFAKPLLGILFCFQNYLSDEKKAGNYHNNFLNKPEFTVTEIISETTEPNFIEKDNFNKKLTQISICTTNINLESHPISTSKMNLKRKNQETSFNEDNKYLSHIQKKKMKKGNLDIAKNTNEDKIFVKKNISSTIDKNRERVENSYAGSELQESSSLISNDDEIEKTCKANKNIEKKKKIKLKFA
jgi:hypothetical protein